MWSKMRTLRLLIRPHGSLDPQIREKTCPIVVNRFQRTLKRPFPVREPTSYESSYSNLQFTPGRTCPKSHAYQAVRAKIMTLKGSRNIDLESKCPEWNCLPAGHSFSVLLLRGHRRFAVGVGIVGIVSRSLIRTVEDHSQNMSVPQFL